MALQPSTSSSQTAGSSQQSQRPVFEFTRKKRWAEILVSELPETIIFVLSAACKILYCENAVRELLGWNAEDLVDSDLFDLINENDRLSFRQAFHDALFSKQQLFCYARLKCKKVLVVRPDLSTSCKELLFEIKGRPHFLPDDNDCKCFIAMARPYPSRNTAALNTFLELKIEKERLMQRVADLRAQTARVQTARAASAHAAPPPLSMPMSIPSASPLSAYTQTSFAMPGARTLRGADDVAPSPTRGTFDVLNMGDGYGGHAFTDDGAEDARRKKPRRVLESQYVCVQCGRTDSPEWRKGPAGPKTLCNACGLRWAKTERKSDDPPGLAPRRMPQAAAHGYARYGS